MAHTPALWDQAVTSISLSFEHLQMVGRILPRALEVQTGNPAGWLDTLLVLVPYNRSERTTTTSINPLRFHNRFNDPPLLNQQISL